MSSYTLPHPTDPSEAGDFSIFTSLRYDPQLLSSPANTTASSLSAPTPFYLLSHHRDRMLAAAIHFSYPLVAISILHSLEAYTQRLQEAVDACTYGRERPLKLRPILTRQGGFTIETSPMPPVPLSQLFPQSLLPDPASMEWQIVVDTQPTAPSSFTNFKTTARDIYNAARERGGIKSWADMKEVVLWNENNEAMEGSFTTVYVPQGEEWITPVVESGGQQGTTRRWALENGLVKEGVVRISEEELKKGSCVVVSNGVRGFWGGWVV
ncbi:aminotransferase class IV-domain-containing protein [Trichophaea hybrida]|nr:aminotransferase class IV-domain-containing protein [Trichophaea hybrida]